MTTTNPAFVKAFARRTRSASSTSRPRPANRPQAADESNASVVDPNALQAGQPDVQETAVDAASLTATDGSVAESVEPRATTMPTPPVPAHTAETLPSHVTGMWVDTSQERFARADYAEVFPPAPHVELVTTPLPETQQPETQLPETPQQETQLPETTQQETQQPETPQQETQLPETPQQETQQPESPFPETQSATNEIVPVPHRDVVADTSIETDVVTAEPTPIPFSQPSAEVAGRDGLSSDVPSDAQPVNDDVATDGNHSEYADAEASMQHVHTAFAAASLSFSICQLDTMQSDEVGLGSEVHLSNEVATGNQVATSNEVATGNEVNVEPADVDPEIVEARATSETLQPVHAQPEVEPTMREDVAVVSKPLSASETQAVVSNETTVTSATEQRFDAPRNQPPKPHTQPPLIPFQPVWEVDVFDIPRVVADLFFDGELFQQIAERMGEAVNSGLNSVLVTSTKPGEGRTSVAVGMAMAAAAAGIRVALVDVDTEKPTLADDLRLELQYGWVDTIRGGLPISEVAVHAVEDGVTLIPLMTPHGATAATSNEVVQLLEALRNRFELVIIDGPTEASSTAMDLAAGVDTAIIVSDVTRCDSMKINEFSYRLREAGVSGVGVVENFA